MIEGQLRKEAKMIKMNKLQLGSRPSLPPYMLLSHRRYEGQGSSVFLCLYSVL